MECELCDARIHEPYRVVYSDELVFVMVNLEPVKYGHVMILPTRHAQNLGDLTPAESKAFLAMADRCMNAVKSMSEHFPMFMVHGWGHRTQSHLHAHVIPSEKGIRGLFAAADGIAEERKRAERDVLQRICDDVRAEFIAS